MNRSERHPDSVLLDRLRAGLLDDAPEQKARLQQHLQQCPQCRHSYNRTANLLPATPGLNRRLDDLRHQALAVPPAGRHRWQLSLAAAAALALLAVTLVNLQPGEQNTNPQIATRSQATPDLYEDLDFYLWLANHKGTGNSST